ncbi:hypothetical protein [Pedobacter sp. NJ-S-72]
MVDALTKNNNYAQELVTNQILAPYQKSWTNVGKRSIRAWCKNQLAHSSCQTNPAPLPWWLAKVLRSVVFA